MALRKLLAAVLAAAVIGAVAAPAAHAAEFEGVVIAKSDKAKTFTLRQDEGGGTFKIKVNADTTYQRLSGFGAIKVGARNIEATARKSGKVWIASVVEISGGGGGGGGDDGPGDDD